jgi:PelA/Pel-15E family pectate lyase
MIKRIFIKGVLAASSFLVTTSAVAQNNDSKAKAELTDELRERMAHNMLVYQRNIGGWPKHVNEVKINYAKELSAAEEAATKKDGSKNDATIDNNATIKEIRFLTEQFKKTNNKAYLDAVHKGIAYLIKAQYANGGWPQFYPDFSNYRHQITYNDNAMVNVLNLLQDVAEKRSPFDVVDPAYIAEANAAVKKGVDCIVKTQVKVNGQLTSWCAQYDEKTLQPAKARAFELVSLSGSETVGITEFLMRQRNPSPEVKAAIVASVNWLQKVKVEGVTLKEVKVAGAAKGYDRVVEPEAGSVLWARFYDVDTNEPFFCGRDGVKRKNISEIEYERRNGYSWYGTWPKTLLEKKYPAWAASNSIALK